MTIRGNVGHLTRLARSEAEQALALADRIEGLDAGFRLELALRRSAAVIRSGEPLVVRIRGPLGRDARFR